MVDSRCRIQRYHLCLRTNGHRKRIEGFHEKQHDLRGIIPRSIEQIFSYISHLCLHACAFLSVHHTCRSITRIIVTYWSLNGSLAIREDKNLWLGWSLSEWVLFAARNIHIDNRWLCASYWVHKNEWNIIKFYENIIIAGKVKLHT